VIEDGDAFAGAPVSAGPCANTCAPQPQASHNIPAKNNCFVTWPKTPAQDRLQRTISHRHANSYHLSITPSACQTHGKPWRQRMPLADLKTARAALAALTALR
jgi:hypothetical protein